MATEPVLPFSVVSVVEDVIQKHGSRLSDMNLASRRAEEASSRRNEAATWLRKTVGVVAGRELPAAPSEEDLRIALRSGIVLCTALNKIQPGSVPKVVEAPSDADVIPDGAALSVFQYFENVRNFLVALEELGLPTFDASDLEQGGNSMRIVNCILGLKSYSEWKLGGKIGIWKYSGNPKPQTIAKPIMRKNSEPFMRSLSRAMSLGDKDGWLSDNNSPSSDITHDRSVVPFSSLSILVRDFLTDKKPEEIPILVESLLSKVMEEFEQRMLIQQETIKTIQEDKAFAEEDNASSEEDKASPEEDNPTLKAASSVDEEMEENEDLEDKQQECEEDKRIEDMRIEDKRIEDRCNEDKRIEDRCIGDKRKEAEILLLRSQILQQQQVFLKHQQVFKQQNKSIKDLKTMVHQTKIGMQTLQKKHQEEIVHLGKNMHSVASAASKYQKVVEENRKLYNQVQDLKGNIRVYCRVRPITGGHASQNGSVSNIEEGSISLIIPAKNGKDGKKSFTFNRAFGPSATQAEVFADTQPLIRSVLDGYNVCILAYGQTGSGKTHTMSGPNNLTEETVGVNYRALRDLFLLSEQRKDTIHYDIRVQMLEIYNELVRDLLTTDGVQKKLEIRNSSHNGINVPDAILVPVSSTEDVLYLMNLGHKNRAVSATAMNDRSSRSHSCLTVHVSGKDLTSGNSIRGCIHLVDLAGSERVDKSEVTGDRLKEAQHINKSLAALGDVIASLSNKQSHVPYRNSKLTQLLQDSLGGQAKTLMFVHISPEPEALVETISTLKFAERVSTIELGAAKVNKDSSDVKELKEQIVSLKAALAKKDDEAEHFGIPEMPRLKSQLSTPLPSRKLPRDDSNSIEDQKKTSSNLKRRSLDLEDMYMNSPPSTPGARENGKEDDKESSVSSMNRNESSTSLAGQWEAEVKPVSSPMMLSPRYLGDPSKTCDSDEPELATSECSDPLDMNWQSQLPKLPRTITTTGVSNGSGSNKAKSSPKAKQGKNQETRSVIPSLTPSSSSSKKQTSQPSQPKKYIDAKRRTGLAK